MQRRRGAIVGLVLVALIAAAYGQTARHEFIDFDDGTYITKNPDVLGGLTARGVAWAFTAFHGANWHPLTWLSHMLDCQWFGLAPGAHHLHNVLLHAINTVLLFAALRALTRGSGASADDSDFWPCALVAALFGLHPIHVESVAWAAERKDLLCALFWLLAMWSYARYAASPPGRRRRAWYGLVFVLVALGLLSKPMLVTLPFALLLLDYWPLGRISWSTGGPWRQRGKIASLIAEKVPLMALVAASCVVTFLAQRHGGAVSSLSRVPLEMRAANAVLAYAVYLVKTVGPVDLCFYYPHWSVMLRGEGIFGFRGLALVAAAVLLAMTVAVMWWGRRLPYLLVGWLWYLGTLLPVIGLVQVGDQGMADRYTYIPLVGVFIIVAWGGRDLWTWASWRARWRTVVAAAVSCLIIVALALLTWRQTATWRNNRALFEHAARIIPNHYLAHTNLGAIARGEGRHDDALMHFMSAVKGRPEDTLARMNLASEFLRRDRMDDAYRQYEWAKWTAPEMAAPDGSMGMIRARQGRLAEARQHFERAVRRDGQDTQYRFALAEVLTRLGLHANALPHYEAAVRLDPKDSGAHRGLADVLSAAERWPEAETHYRRAIALDSVDSRALAGLGRALLQRGDAAGAVVQYRRAIEVGGEHRPTAANDLAWIMATHPDSSVRNGADAVALAREACQAVQFSSPEALDTLAAAYAEVGQFDEAVKTAARAMELAAAAGKVAVLAQVRARQVLYAARKPFREG